MSKKKFFISLKSKLILILILALITAAVVFVTCKQFGDFLVWKYYLDEETKQERAENYIEDFQKYVKNKKLSIHDSKKIAAWSGGNYVDMIVYKDKNLVYAPDWFIDSSSPQDYFSGDRDFEQYLTEEARTAYLERLEDILDENSDLSSVYFVDGTLLVRVIDYTEDFVYSLVFAAALLLALIVLAIIMILNFSATASRIKRLARDVRLVEGGNLELPIAIRGHDELSSLAEDVNSMRNSVVDTMTKEQQAWKANAELITAMSHDIRTPLTVMLGYLELMEMQEKSNIDSEYVAACKDNALRLKRLSDDMFSYFLVFGKKDALDGEMIDVGSEVIEHMLAERVILFEESGFELSYSHDLPSVTISVNLDYLGRVIDNVFANIQKYADLNAPVYIESEIKDGNLTLAFRNKIDKSSDRAESNGIGLKTCERIMERMGGSVTVVAESDDYSITLNFPVKEQK
ncbi:MAG: HAMP domain-containing histidine kinase [Clostridia bacterium]|nr:HAMP domain-containing histidine kinase [Clostridia bacterium]